VKVVLVLLALCACERADSPKKQAPPPPTPTKPDPIHEARDEFELIPQDYAVGTHKLYARGEFMPDADPETQFDEGDFIGRLRALFGARAGDEYVLRHKQTGYVITAYSGNSGPTYGGGARYPGALPPPDPKALFAAGFQADPDPAVEARKRADPVLANGNPFAHPSPDHPLDLSAMNTYMKHLDDAEAGPELAAVVARLDALVSAVPPVDWDTTYFYEDGPSVIHVGVSHGESFSDEVPAAEGFEFLANQPASWRADSNLLEYYLANKDALAADKPRAITAYQRFVGEAKSEEPGMRKILLGQARDVAKQLGVR
jgi:hypothetical protein